MADIIEAFVAFDTSKLRNAVAIAEAGRTGEVRFLGEIENTGAAVAKLVRKLAGKYGRLTFCYEAGPTGYGLHRHFSDFPGPEISFWGHIRGHRTRDLGREPGGGLVIIPDAFMVAHRAPIILAD